MRIIGGTARGRRLTGPPTGTRPTSDRAREAMFNTLAGYLRLDGARVLDLYAGTGAVGLEALSRGAEQVVFVEKGRAALDVLRRNVEAVGLPGAEVVGGPVSAFLRDVPDAERPGRTFDLVFADPPYALEVVKVVGTVIAVEDRMLAPDGVIVVERDARTGDPFAGLSTMVTVREARYGDTTLWYGRRR